ncbi:Rho GTPase activation protein [Sporodiniella umbellata]|nr:Rho GTPase activation protein [Sporodiniella umbellata]
MELFASLYFQTQPKGWWKRSIPLNQWMEWTKESIRQPLLNNHQSSEACKSFKLLQVLMGDRWRPRGHDPLNSMHIVLSLGLSKVVMRDEIYVQLFKQLNKNPSAESIEKGWIIVLMVTMTFPPSKRLAPHFCDFVTQENHKLSKTILIRLEQILFKGARGKVPSMAEIKRTLETPYQPSVFGESIETVMGLEQDMNTGMPRVMVFLTEAILYLDGKQTEGIFRIPGDADVITDLRIRIDNGEYDLEGVQDPNVPASLLKCWLRDLSEPLIPSRLYQQCIQSASEGDQVLRLLQLLPDANRRILIYMTRFLQQFLDPHVVQNTLMTAHNLALVFAPNYFKCPLTHLPTLFENSKHEQTFVITLMSVL